MYRESVLDFDSLARGLRRLADAAGWQVAIESCTSSTNDAVRALMSSAQGEVAGVALASTQTAGVGRRGARWSSGPGDGLWFSVVVPAKPSLPAAPPSLAVAGELAERLRRFGVPAELKWPNDLYLEDGKLGGLMLERGRIGGQQAWLVGVGINWRLPRDPLAGDYPPAALESVPHGSWREDPVGLGLELISATVAVMESPGTWAAALERLRRHHRWFGVPVEVCGEEGACYAGIGGEIRPDGQLEIQRADGHLAVVGPNDRVRAAPSD